MLVTYYSNPVPIPNPELAFECHLNNYSRKSVLNSLCLTAHCVTTNNITVSKPHAENCKWASLISRPSYHQSLDCLQYRRGKAYSKLHKSTSMSTYDRGVPDQRNKLEVSSYNFCPKHWISAYHKTYHSLLMTRNMFTNWNVLFWLGTTPSLST